MVIDAKKQVDPSLGARVMTVGNAVVDYVFQAEKIPVTPEKHFAQNRYEIVGGIAANAALAIQALGGQSIIVSRIADDSAGTLISKTLASAGVDLSLLDMRPGFVSAASAVIVDKNGERMIINHRSKALFGAAPVLDPAHVESVGAVLGDLRWMEATEAAFELAHGLGVPTVLDFDLSDAQVSERVLVNTDAIVFGHAAMCQFAGTDHVETALRAVSDRMPDARVAVTVGGQGVAYVEEDASVKWIAPHAVAVRSTLGAGDVFHGAFALAIAEGQTFEAALAFANDVAALKISTPPDQAKFPSRSDVNAFQRSMS